VLRAVAFDDATVLGLSAAMVAELSARYGDGGASPAGAAEFAGPVGVFLVAELDGRPVGCGGVRLLSPGTGEVKRMYVDPAFRGRGVARGLLHALVAHARGAGLTRLWLETGTAQPEAMALYASEGFAPVPPYGHFREDPRSRCFALDLR